MTRVPAQGESARTSRLTIAMRKQAGTLIKPDWASYLSRRKKELWKRLPPKSEDDNSLWISMDWHTLFRHWGEDLEYNATHLPWRTIMDGDGRTEIVPFKIPWYWRDDDIVKAFRAWLKDNRPKGEEGVMEICGKSIPWSDDRPRIDEPQSKPKDKGGAGSHIRQVKKILKALAAWRLIQHYMGDNFDAYAHPGAEKYLGKAYAHPSEWTDARKTVQAALRNFRFY